VPLQVGKFQRAGAFEPVPKDTFVSPPGTITVWVGKYTIGTDGVSVWHCHILSHEDNAMAPMMRPLAVGTKAQTQLPRVGTLTRLDARVRPPYRQP
jgi:FtsP/CotA-like multicopper oxidase with cupredoxin domain